MQQGIQHSLRVLHCPAVRRPASRQDLHPVHLRRCKHACRAANSSEDALASSLFHSPSVHATANHSNILQTDGKQLAQLLLLLSELQVRPHQEWLTDVLNTLQPQLSELSASELSGCLQALGSWGMKPPAAFMLQFQAATNEQLQQQKLGMRHVGQIAWSLAQLQDASTAVFFSQLLDAAQQQLSTVQPASLTTHCGMADLIWAVAKLQRSPGQAWLGVFEAASQRHLNGFTPHELAQIVWALARLSYTPAEPWREGFLQAVQDRLKEFDSKSISLTAWALATLKFTPTSRWLFNFERQAECVLSTLAAAELACTLWALSELKQKRPHELRLGRLVRRQEVFHQFDFQLLVNPKLLRVVRNLTLGPQSKAG